jgi:hypothetical protein
LQDQHLAGVRRLERDAAPSQPVYHERSQIVALLARLFPGGIRRTAIEGWDEEWQGCAYIDLPTGQVSWHYHDNDAHLFAALPSSDGGVFDLTSPGKNQPRLIS